MKEPNLLFMNKDLMEDKPSNEPIVIPDECGDSLWDAVLAQEVKTETVKGDVEIQALPNSIDTVQECDASKVE